MLLFKARILISHRYHKGTTSLLRLADVYSRRGVGETENSELRVVLTQTKAMHSSDRINGICRGNWKIIIDTDIIMLIWTFWDSFLASCPAIAKVKCGIGLILWISTAIWMKQCQKKSKCWHFNNCHLQSQAFSQLNDGILHHYPHYPDFRRCLWGLLGLQMLLARIVVIQPLVSLDLHCRGR